MEIYSKYGWMVFASKILKQRIEEDRLKIYLMINMTDSTTQGIEHLRSFVRGVLKEDLKNVRAHHERTTAGTRVLQKMHDAPGVLEALSNVEDPKELAHVIEAIIDAVPIVRKSDVLKALFTVQSHERKARKR